MNNKYFVCENLPIIHKLNINKVKTLEDVIKIIDALNIEITSYEGTTCELYEKLKDYFD
jgi:hypothetical protein